MKKLVFCAVAVLMGSHPVQAEELKVVVHGAHCCAAGRLAAAFETVPGVKVKGKKYLQKCSTGGHTFNFTVQVDPSKADLGELARAALAARTSRDKTLSVIIVLPASGINGDKAKQLAGALKEVKGVDARGSTADVAKKEIHVKLDDKGGARLGDIQKALNGFVK